MQAFQLLHRKKGKFRTLPKTFKYHCDCKDSTQYLPAAEGRNEVTCEYFYDAQLVASVVHESKQLP